MARTLRLATSDDAAAIAAIYAPIVRDTAISFEVDPPGSEEMRGRIESTLKFFPWLVCDGAGTIEGYAYAGQHRPRAAYQWSVDVSVYIHENHRGRGVGKALYTALLEIVRRQGLYNAYAGITLPNSASVALHESVGFTPLAVYPCVGFKQGRWHDVGWWELSLGPRADCPSPPTSLANVAASGMAAALSRGNELLEG